MRVRLSCRWRLAVIVTTAALLSPNRVVRAADATPLADDGGFAAPAWSEPSGELTLAAAIGAALRHAPELAGSAAELSAIDARIVQVDVWPNPGVGVDVEDVAGSGTYEGAEQSQTTLWLSQPVELGGKRAKRRRVADLARRGADWQLAVRRLAVVTEVKKRYAAVLLAQEREALGRELETLSSGARRNVDERVKSGAAATAEQAQVRISLGRAQLARKLAQRQTASARRQLAATWGGSEPLFTAVRGRLEDISPPPPLDELLSLLDRNPGMARWDAAIEQQAAVASLEQANRIPDVSLTAGGRHYGINDDYAAVFSLSVPIPVFDRNQGSVLEAESLVAKARAEREAAYTRARADLAAAHADLQSHFERVTTLRDDVLDHAETATRETAEAHRRGAAHMLEVLATQRVLFDLREEYLQALADYHSTLADIEQLAAAVPEEMPR